MNDTPPTPTPTPTHPLFAVLYAATVILLDHAELAEVEVIHEIDLDGRTTISTAIRRHASDQPP